MSVLLYPTITTTLNLPKPFSTTQTLSFPTLSRHTSKPHFPIFSISPNSNPNDLNNPKHKPKPKPKPKRHPSSKPQPENDDQIFPKTIPRKPRRGRRSEAVAVEDFIRGSLEQTFDSIRQQSSQVLEEKETILKDKDDVKKKKGEVVEEDDPNWPLDADIGWGIRASEYFDKHSIKNVVGEDGIEIDWEGEVDDSYVKEINCLEWESFAFHPSPLIVLVFERYNKANANWKFLKELEKAIAVYWNAKDRLPPRSVKIDINIERDLAYALKVKDGPQLLFLKGNRILYREEEIRTADELVQMIAHFYYNAKKPSWIDDAALAPPY